MSQRGTDRYPDSPGHKPGTGADAAADAAEAIKPRANILAARALRLLHDNPNGLTADEIAAHMGCPVLAIRPRVSELVSRGEIRKTGQRRRNVSGQTATVWVVVKPFKTDLFE